MNQIHPHTLRIGIGHLFATGSNPSRDSIFHIACTCYTADAPPESKQWVLNPGRKITDRLYQKSRVSTELCSQAPRWDDVGPRHITPFFADLDILLVFNLENEIKWFQKVVLKTAKTPPVGVDLFEMAQFFLPDQVHYNTETLLDQTLGKGQWRSGHRLPYLIRGFQAVLHDIITSIRSTRFVFAFLQQAIMPSNTPIEFSVIYEIARQASQIKWTTDLFAQDFPRLTPPALAIDNAKQLIGEIHALLPTSTPENPPRLATRSEPKPITPAHIDQGFEMLAVTTNGHLQHRPDQREYAKACARALNEGGLYALEAGTGTGKTLGYLLPLCELLRQSSGRQVLIATATKNLQDQIIEQEIPRLTSGKTLYHNIKATVLKGKANYLCITALTDLYEEVYIKDQQNAAERLAWLYLYVLLLRKHGEIEGIPRVLKDRFAMLPDFVEEVNAQMACLPGLCRVGQDCIYPRRLRTAGAADIVITNQHKLASVEASLVLNAAACLIDEADQFPENFRSAIRKQLSAYQIRRRFIRRLVGAKKRRGYVQILEERFLKEGDFAANAKDHDILNTCLGAIETVLSECGQIETSIHHIAAVPHLHNDTETRWLNLQPVEAGKALQKMLKLLADQFERIGGALKRILSSGRYHLLKQPVETEKTRFLRREKIRIEKYQNLARDLMRDARDIAADYPSDAFVHVFEQQGRGWTLSKVPYDIKEALDVTLFRPIATVLFTSASLFVRQRLDLFASELFLDQPFTDTFRIRSPFDFDANVFGAVTTFIPRFDYKAPRLAQEQWRNNVARTIAALVVATYGRTLVLFTNAREMRSIFNQIRPILQAHDIDPLLQDGSSLAEIQAFRLTEHSALFGVNRFWTGVDFPGPTLSQVIVVRLPNPNLSNPLIQHRRDQMGEAFWERYYRPFTSLKLKQGFGRLIRSEKDRGLFVVLDRRLVTDLRMRPLQDELPITLRSYSQEWNRTHQGDLQDLITQGLKKLGLHQEFVERNIDVYKLNEA